MTKLKILLCHVLSVVVLSCLLLRMNNAPLATKHLEIQLFFIVIDHTLYLPIPKISVKQDISGISYGHLRSDPAVLQL